MKNIQNKLFLVSITMLAVVFMTSGCEFESAGDVSKDILSTVLPTPPPPSCADGIDNDGDGVIDDADTESCDPNGDGLFDDALGEFYYPGCNDGVNNDATGADGIVGNADDDTLIDLDDPDCLAVSNGGTGTGEIFTDVPVFPSFCEDGLDNDLDGATDLADTDCVVGGSGEIPAAPKENCADGIDNDGDGLTDAADTADCLGDGLGESYLPNCNDGEDNDGDGDFDLADSDCQGGEGEQVSPPPPPALPNCADGIDNDGDGLTDDADTESCDPGGGGETYLPNCNDDINQDDDEFTDLLDLDCQAISNGGTGTGEFIPISIPDEVGETTDSGEELANSVPEDATEEEAAAAIEGTPAGEVIAASTALTDPETEEGQANALAVEEIQTALTDLAGDVGTGELTDIVTVAAFTNTITDSIAEYGVLPGAVVSESIDELMADVAGDSVLAALLASFDLGGRGSGPLVSPPLLYKTFGTQGYEECVDDCNALYSSCAGSCFDGAQTQHTTCTANANSTNSGCSSDVVTNFTTCNADAGTVRDACTLIITTEYDACMTDLNTNAENNQAACIAIHQADYDGCVSNAGTAFTGCTATASSNTSTCSQSALDQNVVNVNTAMEQFNQMMAMSTSLLANPALAVYATFIQTVALCNFMNNIMIGVDIKDADMGYCNASEEIQNDACTAENTANEATCIAYLDDSGCNDFAPDPLDNQCTAYQFSQTEACNTQYSNNVTGCTDNQNIGNTNCSAALTSALNECDAILTELDCGECSIVATACIQTCHDEAGAGGGG